MKVNEKKTRKITVKFERGEVSVNPPSLGGNCRENIQWEGNCLFVIGFGDRSPCKHFKYHSENKNGRFVVEAPVIYNDELLGARRFKYSVAATQNGAIDIVDPEIIIPRRPGIG